MEWFTFGIDRVISYLEKRLQGILIHTVPSIHVEPHGAPHQPANQAQGQFLPAGKSAHGQTAYEGLHGPHHQDPPHEDEHPTELRYKVIAYCDDVKPAITSIEEFILVEKAMSLFEKSSGCKLHRDPAAGKCKFLALGRWREVLSQEDLPCNFFSLSNHLDILGVTLTATHTSTRKINGYNLQDRMKGQIGAWISGKFMNLTMRPHRVNCYAYSKLWHKCYTLTLGELGKSGPKLN